jgi:hypothetical protein
MRKFVLITGVLLVMALTSGVAVSGPTKTSAAASDPLVGTWDTGPITIRKLRTALAATGYTRANMTAFFKQFGITNAYEFKRVFYREGAAPFLWYKGWDPSKGDEPSDNSHGPYTLLPNRRFVSRGVDPPSDRIREVYSYTVTGKRLKLKLVGLTEPASFDLFSDRMWLRASAAFPYKRVG